MNDPEGDAEPRLRIVCIVNPDGPTRSLACLLGDDFVPYRARRRRCSNIDIGFLLLGQASLYGVIVKRGYRGEENEFVTTVDEFRIVYEARRSPCQEGEREIGIRQRKGTTLREHSQNRS